MSSEARSQKPEARRGESPPLPRGGYGLGFKTSGFWLLASGFFLIIALLWLDQPVAAWAIRANPIAQDGAWRLHSDTLRELAMLEQWGQWVCSVLVILAVALLDREGRRRALAIAIGCLATVLITYLLKDFCGRSRPAVFHDGSWQWGGPQMGFTTKGSAWGSFPSAHTTGAFALSVGLAWFYPRARILFITLAAITAVQRILHHAHFVSDVLAGIALAIFITRWTLQAKLADRLLGDRQPPALPEICSEKPEFTAAEQTPGRAGG
ncbi:MAG: phosphatase PAP2 family protein [Phycisphaerales bacterium]|nr:phosphatase PAP2 family protein [Phycisphaerales bacterium]